MVQIMGKQYVRKSAIAKAKGLSTKEMLKSDRSVVSKYELIKCQKNDKTNYLYSRTSGLMNGFQMNGRVVDPQKQSIVVELLLMKKTQARLQQRCVSIPFTFPYL